jgi:deoxyribonuclease-4
MPPKSVPRPVQGKKPPARQTGAAPASPGRIDLPKGVLLGAHTSIAGGVARAVERAQGLGFTAAQIFVKNNKQWFAPPLGATEAEEFVRLRKASGIRFFAHNSYLVNLASPNDEMYTLSVKAMIAEVERAEALGLPFIVMHPGSHGGSGEDAGLQRIVRGVDEIVAATSGYACRLALEITAGQGNALGYRLEHLSRIIDRARNEKRFGVCLDTAHLYAAGYNIAIRAGYDEMMNEVSDRLGFARVLGLHLNDSKVPLGKRVDRHAHLGEGEIGLECFTWLVRDPHWAKTPKVLETPKSEDMHEDVENLRKLASYLQ